MISAPPSVIVKRDGTSVVKLYEDFAKIMSKLTANFTLARMKDSPVMDS